MEFRKNDIVTVTIEDIGSEGEGIGKADGFTLFVKDAVVGDTVEARIVKNKKNYAYARMEKVVKPSPFRVEPKCQFYRQCGGCQLQALSYEKQLEFKQSKIRNSLIRIGGFAPEYVDERMEPILGMDNPFHYRNKAQYPVGTDREGNVITGFYAGRTHSIIANTDCLLGAEVNREVLECVLEYMHDNCVSAYDEATGTGLVRHVLIREGFASGEIMVCLIINGRKRKATGASCKGRKKKQHPEFLPNQDELLQNLAKIKGMTSVSVNINAERTNVIMGNETYTLWGKDTISDSIRVRDMASSGYPFTGKELTFHISPRSFYQVNPVQTEKLYSLVLEYAGLTGEEVVWDLYCGIGTISLFLADRAKKVYGVEIIPQAIADARDNAQRNGIRNAEFFVGKAEDVLRGMGAKGELDVQQESDMQRQLNVQQESDVRRELNVQQESDMQREQDAQQGQDMLCESGMQAERIQWSRNEDIQDKGVNSHCFGSRGQWEKPDVVVVDPPRKGCDGDCLNAILKMQPERIVYVSCDPATLARDLRILCDGGYEIRRIRGTDMFGMTVHVETVVMLSHEKSTA